jgi:uncharacterized membrane protein
MCDEIDSLMSTYVFAFLIGVIAGLRSLTAPAVVCWAARLGWLHLENTPLAFMAAPVTTYILSALAVGELIADQLPTTPSRKSPMGFGARLMTGALCGAALAAQSQSLVVGLAAGVLGAVAGTLGGYEARVRLAKAIGKDLPAALLEDAIAIGGAFWIASQIS